MFFNSSLSKERLYEKTVYDKDTGEFYWRRKRGLILAGSYDQHGYIVLNIDNKPWMAHRLAWIYVYGEHPRMIVDHINGKRDDNRIVNLRQATHRQNAENFECHRNGKAPGVRLRYTGYWESVIHINNKYYHLGTFDTEEEGIKMREDCINSEDPVAFAMSVPKHTKWDRGRKWFKSIGDPS